MYFHGLTLGRAQMDYRAAFACGGFGIAMLAAGVARAQNLIPMDDMEMAAINARGALFVADKIAGDSANTFTNFTYYRMGLDVELALNMNIDRMRLGCGGSNDQLAVGGSNGAICDISLDYVRFMGRNGDVAGAIGSDFVLNRPYIELAIKNDGDRNQREVVGIKIGSKSADGVLSIGRTYANGQVNLEGAPGGAPDATCTGGPGERDPACHSGINSISGYLNAELSGNAYLQAGTQNSEACFGYTRLRNETNGTTSVCNSSTPLYRSFYGTRMTRLLMPNVILSTYNSTNLLNSLADGSAKADISESLRFVHSIVLNKDPGKTRDFFISFQREQVGYPIFDQAAPYDTDGVSGSGGNSQRFSKTANTGWWMNVPYAALLDVQAGTISYVTVLQLTDALGEGINIVDLTLGQEPADNCYGTSSFC